MYSTRTGNPDFLQNAAQDLMVKLNDLKDLFQQKNVCNSITLISCYCTKIETKRQTTEKKHFFKLITKVPLKNMHREKRKMDWTTGNLTEMKKSLDIKGTLLSGMLLNFFFQLLEHVFVYTRVCPLVTALSSFIICTKCQTGKIQPRHLKTLHVDTHLSL